MYRKIRRFVGKIVHRQCCRLYSKITLARPLISKDKGLIVGKMVETSFVGAYDDEEATATAMVRRIVHIYLLIVPLLI